MGVGGGNLAPSRPRGSGILLGPPRREKGGEVVPAPAQAARGALVWGSLQVLHGEPARMCRDSWGSEMADGVSGMMGILSEEPARSGSACAEEEVM